MQSCVKIPSGQVNLIILAVFVTRSRGVRLLLSSGKHHILL